MGWLSAFLTKVAQGTPRGSVLPETAGTGRHLEGGQALRATALWGCTARKACGRGRSLGQGLLAQPAVPALRGGGHWEQAGNWGRDSCHRDAPSVHLHHEHKLRLTLGVQCHPPVTGLRTWPHSCRLLSPTTPGNGKALLVRKAQARGCRGTSTTRPARGCREADLLSSCVRPRAGFFKVWGWFCHF